MYMAQIDAKGITRYLLRHSFKTEKGYFSRDLLDLGEDPSCHIVYPGGNAFYVDELVVERLEELGIDVDADVLEGLFHSFVKPEIREAVETFHSRGESSTKAPLTKAQVDVIRYGIPLFDKRRLHFLKFGHIDPGPLENMPEVIFRPLLEKSRDEIEQYFISHEKILDLTELKTYLYAAMNLQRFFQSFLAKRMPQALDQDAVEAYFIEELCCIQRTLFQESAFHENAPLDASCRGDRSGLHEYLKRYVIMFFDHGYADSSLLNDMARRFMDQHRFYTVKPPRKQLKEEKALEIMGLTKEQFQGMNQRRLARHYRKLAGKHHPDRGGSSEAFVRLSEAYESLQELQGV